MCAYLCHFCIGKMDKYKRCRNFCITCWYEEKKEEGEVIHYIGVLEELWRWTTEVPSTQDLLVYNYHKMDQLLVLFDHLDTCVPKDNLIHQLFMLPN